jgi:hypothetical protein
MNFIPVLTAFDAEIRVKPHTHVHALAHHDIVWGINYLELKTVILIYDLSSY